MGGGVGSRNRVYVVVKWGVGLVHGIGCSCKMGGGVGSRNRVYVVVKWGVGLVHGIGYM